MSVSLNQEMLFISAPRYYDVSTIRLVDLCGAEISLDNHDFGSSLVKGMEIETLKSGTYFVIIQSSDQVKSLPFIKI